MTDLSDSPLPQPQFPSIALMIQRITAILFLAISATIATSAQNFWQQTQGPQDGDISALAADSSGTIYSPNQGGFVSTDDGQSWSRPGAGTAPGQTATATLDDQGTIYVIANAGSSGIWRSTDHGVTWYLFHGLSAYGNTALAINPDGVLFASGGGALVRYGMDDTAWKDIRINKAKPTDNADSVRALLFVRAAGALVAGTAGGIYRTTDNGANWRPAMGGMGVQRVNSLAKSFGGDIYASSDSLVFRSTDFGSSWMPLSPHITGTSVITTQGSADVFVATSTGEFLSTSDRGNNWTRTTVPGMFAHSILSTRSGSLLIGSAVNGLFRSTDDGVTWASSNDGMNSSTVQAVAVAPNGRIYAAGIGRYSGFMRSSSDGGQTWEGFRPTPAPTPDVWCLVALANNHVLAGTGKTGVYRTTDNGATWTQQNSGLSGASLGVRSFAIKPNGEVLAGTERGLFVSSDEGTTWRPTGIVTPQIWALAVHPDGTLLAGASNGPIHYSTDGGATWTSVSGFGATTDIQALTVAHDGSVYAASFQSGVFRSTDVGRTWSKLAQPGTTKILFALLEGRDGNIYLGGLTEGFFRSTDRGGSWSVLNNSPYVETFNGIAMDSSGYLLGSSNGHGVLRSTASTGTPSSVETATTPDDNNDVLTSYPNPSNGEMVLSFRIGHASHVQLCLYDLLGNRVATIADRKMGPGSYSLPWNTQGLPAGTYRCMLRTAQETRTTALVVCR